MLPTLSLLLMLLFAKDGIYESENGKVSFESKATLEKIVATSDDLRGMIDPANNAFRFSVRLDSFHGFNSNLQKIHYNDNYVESDQYPNAVFSGKIIEEVNFEKPGSQMVRAKGSFSLHGITLTRIILSKLTVLPSGQISIQSDFGLNLTEYRIKIPRLVHKKVAQEIKIHVAMTLNKHANH